MGHEVNMQGARDVRGSGWDPGVRVAGEGGNLVTGTTSSLSDLSLMDCFEDQKLWLPVWFHFK